jgi:hypothetical protein
MIKFTIGTLGVPLAVTAAASHDALDEMLDPNTPRGAVLREHLRSLGAEGAAGSGWLESFPIEVRVARREERDAFEREFILGKSKGEVDDEDDVIIWLPVTANCSCQEWPIILRAALANVMPPPLLAD